MGRSTGSIDSIRKKHDRFAAFDRSEPRVHRQIDGFIEAGSCCDLCAPNRSVYALPVVCSLAKHVNLFVKGDDHHLVLRPKLVNKCDRRILDVFDLERRRVAHIQNKCNRKRLRFIGKIRYFLLDMVFEYGEVLFDKPADEAIFAV